MWAACAVLVQNFYRNIREVNYTHVFFGIVVSNFVSLEMKKDGEKKMSKI